MKKALLLSATLLLAIITNAQIVNIPDANFKNALLNHYPVIDTNEDSEIQVVEAEAFVDTIDVAWKEISDLTGIEAFINLTGLECSWNQITSLDLSNNIALIRLECYRNQITSLDLSDCVALTYLNCWMNQLIGLELSTNTALANFSCSENQLTGLDLTNNTLLEGLSCNNNQLATLDLSSNIAISSLDCENNQLISLDLSNCTEIFILTCQNNQLSTLNLKNGNNTNLSFFSAVNNPNLFCIEVDNEVWSNNNWGIIDPQTSFSTNCTDGIADIETLTDLTISPNPFTDRVEVALEKHSDYEIRLLDILGKELLATQFNGTSYTLSTSELPKGTYLMHISSKDGVKVEKVVKQ